jgi:hypothetical protein
VIFVSWAISLLFGPKPGDEDFLGRGFKGKLRILVHSSQHIGRLRLVLWIIVVMLLFLTQRTPSTPRIRIWFDCPGFPLLAITLGVLRVLCVKNNPVLS